MKVDHERRLLHYAHCTHISNIYQQSCEGHTLCSVFTIHSHSHLHWTLRAIKASLRLRAAVYSRRTFHSWPMPSSSCTRVYVIGNFVGPFATTRAASIYKYDGFLHFSTVEETTKKKYSSKRQVNFRFLAQCLSACVYTAKQDASATLKEANILNIENRELDEKKKKK